MFENLRNAFREAIENFKEELNRDEVPASVDRLLSGMRDEVVQARVRVKELESEIARAEKEVAVERANARTAVRRGEMASSIGDEETAAVAARFAEKHHRRVVILERKITALREELVLRQGEVEEMLARLEEARAKRDALAATVGRSGARDTLQAADDLFAELDRMAEKIGDEEARAEAATAMDDVELGGEEEEAPEPTMTVEERLAELKRRMNLEG
ncbi:MAG: PspA/IM30 family protein [Gemmatimonadota bacterium]